MTGDGRKAALAAYRERKTSAGIYAVRCLPTGQIWVGRAPDLATIQNRLWFTLRLGRHPRRSLQDAWTHHGAESFTFEVVEKLKDSRSAYVRDASLKERLAHWRTNLDAITI